MAWLLLAAAIVAEVTGTVALRLSNGFSRPVPSLVVAVGYLTAFVLLSQVLQHGMPIGVAYGVWAAAGVALIAIIGVLFLGEQLTWVQGVGLVLVACGVLALELGGAQ